MGVLSRKYFGHLPYLMIQPCMYNRKEYKIVSLHQEPLYEASIASGRNKRSAGGINSAFAETNVLLAFADVVIRRFRLHAPFAITDGLLRVDIFQDVNGKLVVNEIESLDAEYGCSTYDARFQIITHNFLNKYWEKKLADFLTR